MGGMPGLGGAGGEMGTAGGTGETSSSTSVSASSSSSSSSGGGFCATDGDLCPDGVCLDGVCLPHVPVVCAVPAPEGGYITVLGCDGSGNTSPNGYNLFQGKWDDPMRKLLCSGNPADLGYCKHGSICTAQNKAGGWFSEGTCF